MTASRIDADTIRRLPKAVLHDHLDGGLRPATLVELAAEVGHTLPDHRPGRALAAWFYEAANSGDLVRYIATFEHTLAVMQTREGLLRTAEEYVLDLAADGVVYGEVRYAPELNTKGGLTLAEVVETVQEGLAAGMAKAAAAGHPGPRRHAAVRDAHVRPGPRGRRPGGRPSGTPVSSASTSRAPRTASRPPTTWPPSSTCAARASPSPSTPARPTACPASTRPSRSAAPSASATASASPRTSSTASSAASPAGSATAASRWRCAPPPTCRPARPPPSPSTRSRALKDLGFRVTLNTDNRLVSGTTMTREMSLLVERGRLDPRRPAHGHRQRPQERLHPVRRAQRPHPGRRPAGLRLGLRALNQSSYVGGLADVLKVVGQDADQAYAEGDRRLPPLVHDALEVAGGRGRAANSRVRSCTAS